MELELKNVGQICSGVDGISSFFIPSYQRGYRWTELQVTMLLEDVEEAYRKSNASSRYCLQPLAVVLDKNRKAWHVVDGQQRLTTLYILLSLLSSDEKKFSITYETRPGCEEFLKNLGGHAEIKSKENPDYYCMFKVWKVISDWLLKLKDRLSFLQYVQANVEFVWYRVQDSEDPYDIFESLNSGKIALTNAELVKALILRNRDENAVDKRRHGVDVAVVSQEWDWIEKRLRDDAFWYFINPDAKDERFESTRIDFLFEVILRSEKLHAKMVQDGKSGVEPRYLFDDNWRLKKIFAEGGTSGDDFDYSTRVKRNPYFSFSVFNEYVRCCRDNSEQMIWNDVKTMVETFESWYEDKSMFHLVGFLINRRDDNKFEQLLQLVDESRVRSRSKFQEHLLAKVKEVVLGKGVELPKNEAGERVVGSAMSKLSYDKHKAKIYNFLLLFNVALTDRYDSEDIRFPFHRHANMSDRWSLEHIHAKEEEFVVEHGHGQSDLECYEEYLQMDGKGSVEDRVKRVNDRLRELNLQCSIDAKIPDTGETQYEIVIHPDERIGSGDANSSEMSSVDLIHGIWNMALLDRNRNSSFNNGIFFRKLNLLKKWELEKNCESECNNILSDYIPVGTKMVFHKEFSSLNRFPLAWTFADRKDYFKTMKKIVYAYLSR